MRHIVKNDSTFAGATDISAKVSFLPPTICDIDIQTVTLSLDFVARSCQN
jgi:hypothetical protein